MKRLANSHFRNSVVQEIFPGQKGFHLEDVYISLSRHGRPPRNVSLERVVPKRTLNYGHDKQDEPS